MKRSTMFKYFVLTLSIIALAGVAQAEGLLSVTNFVANGNSIVSPDNPVTVDQRLITADGGPEFSLSGTGGATTFDLRKILYSPTIDLLGGDSGATIKFQFYNGGVQKITGNTYHLRVVGKTDGTPGGSFWNVGDLVDFTTTDDIGGTSYYKTMTFRVRKYNDGVNGEIDRISNNVVVVMSVSATTEVPPTVKMDASGNPLEVNVPNVKDHTGTEREAPIVLTHHTVATKVNGLQAHLASVTSTIDVNAVTTGTPTYSPRTSFDPSGSAPDPRTDRTHSTARISVTSTADVGFDLGSDDKYTLSVSRSDNSGVVAFGVDAILSDPTATFNPGTNRYEYSVSSNFGDVPLTTERDATITVTGTTTLYTGTWLMTLAVDPTSSWGVDPPAQNLLQNADSHVWDINGSEFCIPSLHTKTGMYGTDVLMTNKSDLPADITLEIRSETGLGKGAILEITGYKTIAANSFLLIPGSAIQAAVLAAFPSMTNAGNGVRYSAYFTVNAAQDRIFATAYQKDSNGVKRTIQVFTPTTNSNKAWKQ